MESDEHMISRYRKVIMTLIEALKKTCPGPAGCNHTACDACCILEEIEFYEEDQV